MANYDLIPFGTEISGVDAITNVRVTKELVDGFKRLSARDMISVVCKKDHNQSAEILRNLSSDVIQELKPFMVDFKFKGRGQHIQPVLNLQGAFKLLMVLPGERAKLFRSSTAQLLLKYFAGDERLVNEIRANAQFGGLLNEMAREELREQDGGQVAPSPVLSFEEECRRRLEVVKIMKIEDSAKLRRLKVDLEVQAKTVDSEIGIKLKTADADIQIMSRKAASERDILDQESLAKRRRLDEESRCSRLRDLAEADVKDTVEMRSQLVRLGDTLEQVVTTLRGVNFPEDIVANEAARHLSLLKSSTNAANGAGGQAAPIPGAAPVAPAAPVAAPVQPVGGEFTVRSFVAQHQLFRGIPAFKHDSLLRKIGTKLVEKCREQGIILGPQMHEGAYLVHSYSTTATALARAIAEELTRQELAGPTQRDIRASFGAGSAVPA